MGGGGRRSSRSRAHRGRQADPHRLLKGTAKIPCRSVGPRLWALPAALCIWARACVGSAAVAQFASELWGGSRAGWAPDTLLEPSPNQEAVAVQLEPERLVKILEVLRELPAPNYRCEGSSPRPALLRHSPVLPRGLDLSLQLLGQSYACP